MRKSEELFFQYLTTEVGRLKIIATREALVAIRFTEEIERDREMANAITRKTALQLKEYFDGKRKIFDLPLELRGTPFQNRVWEALREIPYGETKSYSEIAEAIGNPKAARAVGLANNKNPVPIIVPCHRVIGKNGNLTGYAGGLWRKEKLLELENENSE